MAKISKRVLDRHIEALELLKKDELHFYDIQKVYDNYHEGAGKMNNLISAHFTPYSIAHSIAHNVRRYNFVDLCAGVGILSYALLRMDQMSGLDEHKTFGVCVENCTEYYQVGKKLLPQYHWINGDVFDDRVIDEIKEVMCGRDFSIVSNPPYGNQVKSSNEKLLYQKGYFEYRAMELGALLGASDGTFLIPQNSAPFRITGTSGRVYDDSYLTAEYKKFNSLTGLEISANNGFTTAINEDQKGWKDVSVVTEIAIVDYEESEYDDKILAAESGKQTSLFV